MKRILVPLDGSALSEAALPAAYGLAISMGAAVSLFHAVEASAPDRVHGERHLADAESANEYLAGLSRSAPASVSVSVHVHDEASRDAATAIADHVDELHSDIVVLATHGKNRFGRFMRGSVAQRAVLSSGAPILTIPAGSAFDISACKTIVVATEGADGHGVPAAWAALLARATGARIVLALVVDTTASLRSSAASVARALPSAAAMALAATVLAGEEYLEAAKLDAAFAGLDVETMVLRGSPDRALSAYAKGLGGVLFVIQTHGKSGLGAFWDGSAAARIVSRLSCPVMLVPAERL